MSGMIEKAIAMVARDEVQEQLPASEGFDLIQGSHDKGRYLADGVDGHPGAALLDTLQHGFPGDLGQPPGAGGGLAGKEHGGGVPMVSLQCQLSQYHTSVSLM